MPTIRRCCIVGCMSNSRLNPSLQFFQFPRPGNPFYKLWTQACQASLSRILPFKKPVLCAHHFHPQCIGGRRLISSAIPTLKLEVPNNLKAVEQQAMVEEIERSRKCAYINAVVYEWLVRANLNPQLRGSITHGMIKEKAETAKQIVGCETFMADNRWLNRFRESHLAGFAQKLASNQLKPMGPSLWIPDIAQELKHLFPPTSAERIENLENMPEQYINYMKQYGEFEEEEETEQESSPPNGTYTAPENGYAEKSPALTYFPPQGSTGMHNYFQQQPHESLSPPPPHPGQGFHPYAPPTAYNAYQDYYNERVHFGAPFNGQHPALHAAPPQPPSPSATSPPHATAAISLSPPQLQPSPAVVRSASKSPVQQQQQQSRPPSRPASNSSQQNGNATTDPLQLNRANSPAGNASTKRRYTDEDEANNNPSSKRSLTQNGLKSRTATPLSDANGPAETNNNDSFKIKLPLLNGKNRRTTACSPTPSSHDSQSRSSSPKAVEEKEKVLSGRTNSSPALSSAATNTKELETYAQALAYLKPLEDFALFKENFRAIGLLSQLENILKKSNRHGMEKLASSAN